MESFKAKYPGFVALLSIAAVFAQDMAAPGETALQKLEGTVNLIKPVVAFVPQASLLGPELEALKAAPADIEGGVELLITDLAFSSDKAKAIIAAAFPLAESLVALAPQSVALIAAIKA